MGGPVLGILVGSIWTLPYPLFPILREGKCPASGSAPSPPLKVQPPLPPGPPYKLPIQGAGPRRCEGWFLSVVVSVYGSFVAVSALARGRPAGGAQRVEETASLAILLKARAS